jgi:predicted transposase/invertase (TIGR01784 family)
VDVKCVDRRGTTYVVEMQVLNVEGFEKRVVYNASKAYVRQLRAGDDYPRLNEVIAVTICDFVLWPEAAGLAQVPLLSRWRMQEQHGGRAGLGEVQYVFLELPKLPPDREPATVVEKWAYLFRQTAKLDQVPEALAQEPYREVLEVSRTAHFTDAEWEAYDRAKIAEQDARGALSLARREGKAEGKAEGEARGKAQGRADAIVVVMRARGLPLPPEDEARIRACQDLDQLDRWVERAASATSRDDLSA